MQNLAQRDRTILDSYTDISVGEIFRRARESACITLDEAAYQTCISRDVLAAIESHNRRKLPERTYTIGFIKTYAQFLGLDPHKMTYLFKRQVIGHKDPNAKPGRRKSPYEKVIKVAFALMISLGVIACIYFAYQALSAIEQKSKEKQAVLQVEDTPYQSQFMEGREIWRVVGQREGKNIYGASYQDLDLVFRATDLVWLEISSADNNETLLSRILQDGEWVHIPAGRFLLSTANAPALDVFKKGKLLGPLHSDKKILEKRALNVEDSGQETEPAQESDQANREQEQNNAR